MKGTAGLVWQSKSLLQQKIPLFKLPLLFGVVLIFFVVGSALMFLIWDLPPLPGDAEGYYLEAAQKISTLPYLSYIHKSFDNKHDAWTHGKEALFQLLSVSQGFFNDAVSLRPFVFILVIAFFLSGIFLFLIARNYFGSGIALICSATFLTSLWTYIYILLPKHQPLGLFYFLFALYLLQVAKNNLMGMVFCALSGISLCCALHSSTVAFAYLPYYVAGFFVKVFFQTSWRFSKAHWVQGGKVAAILASGFAVTLIYFNYPDVLGNLRKYGYYVYLSAHQNHFYYNQPILQQWMSFSSGSPRGGWLWVINYFLLVMPVLFPLSILCIFYLLIQSIKQRRKDFLIMACFILGIGFSTPLLAEAKRISQYGSNYFPALVGFLMILGYTLFFIKDQECYKKSSRRCKGILFGLGFFLFAVHLSLNAYFFVSDVFFPRMGKRNLSHKIESLKDGNIYTYARHPQRKFFTDNLSSSVLKKMHYMNNINQVADGYILIPPGITKTIYNCNVTYADFDFDIYLNEIIQKGWLSRYAVASFPTEASSLLWSQEEEIVSYMSLILHSISKQDLQKARAWILDAKKIQRDKDKNMPREDFIRAVFSGVRNIGKKDSVYRYLGGFFEIRHPLILEKIPMRVYKVGNPSDGLIVYVYALAADGGCYRPYGRNFASKKVLSKDIPDRSDGPEINFQFAEPIALYPNTYYICVYRSGAENDQDFYRIYLDDSDMKNMYIAGTM